MCKNYGETLHHQRRNPTSPRDKRYLSIFRVPIFPCNFRFSWWIPDNVSTRIYGANGSHLALFFSQRHLNQHLAMGVSKNMGTPKSSILIGFSIIFTIHFAVPLIFGNTPINIVQKQLFKFWPETSGPARYLETWPTDLHQFASCFVLAISGPLKWDLIL